MVTFISSTAACTPWDTEGSAARDVLDLAAILGLERALARAEYEGYAISPPLPSLLERHRGRSCRCG